MQRSRERLKRDSSIWGHLKEQLEYNGLLIFLHMFYFDYDLSLFYFSFDEVRKGRGKLLIGTLSLCNS